MRGGYFTKALRNWHGREAGANVSAWLYRIATNTAYDYLRRKQRISFSSLADFEPPDQSAAEYAIDDREPVLQALAELPLSYRLPLILYAYNGHSTNEIAAVLGCSTSAVKTRLFRARERFRQVYQG